MSGVIELFDSPVLVPELSTAVYVVENVPHYYDKILCGVLNGDYAPQKRLFPGDRREIGFYDGTVDERIQTYIAYAKRLGLKMSLERIIQQPPAVRLTFRIDDIEMVHEMMKSMQQSDAHEDEYMKEVFSTRAVI